MRLPWVQLADRLVLFVEAGITRRDETTVAGATLHASKIPIVAAGLTRALRRSGKKLQLPYVRLPLILMVACFPGQALEGQG
jgi:hypothetical protein